MPGFRSLGPLSAPIIRFPSPLIHARVPQPSGMDGLDPMPNSPLQYIDLFAGCGGLSTGLHLSGWKGLPAVERNPAPFSTLKPNLVDQPM